MNNYLNPLLKKADSMPFLFLGSGFSRRYLNTPTWEDLLKYIAEITYQNQTGFQKVKRKASRIYNENTEYNNHMAYLCDLISDDLDDIWYDEDRFATNRDRFWHLVEEFSTPPIKIEIACYLETFNHFNPDYQHEIESLKKIAPSSITGIITTNYDTLQEQLFDYQVYASQEELLFHTKYDLGEIYKIHGCLKNPDSIMINTADYERIAAKHKYIAAKLLTIFIEHPIFFLGYSIGDEDIKEILNDIQLSLTTDQLKEIEDRLFYVVWDPDATTFSTSTYTITFSNNKSITIKQIKLNDYALLYDALSENKAKYPIKLLRHVKEDMYNLVLTNDPKDRMLLSLPDKELTPEEMENIEFVYGFGIMERAKNGYQLVTSDEIYKDIVFDDGNFQVDLLVSKTLPYALPNSGGFLPIRKYTANIPVAELPRIVSNNLTRFNNLNKILSQSLNKEKRRLHSEMTVEMALSGNEKVKKLSLVNYTKDNIEELGEYLRNTLNKDDFKTTNDVRRLIRIYDFIKYS